MKFNELLAKILVGGYRLILFLKEAVKSFALLPLSISDKIKTLKSVFCNQKM
ncbi:hypothetical protein HMPREF1433_01634 [Helicobacter pylori GAMchJs117Ai]|nr:hypothetical protein HMPREF1405_01253 [Helicobacter pylori GAM231Ai]EMJ39000.1 hypothetical protein HMPREF1433_01634 [Helicobacter pylori GAMchJs117Ai]